LPTAPCSAEPEVAAVDPVAWARALERLESGGLVAFPTETVWGLAAIARCAAAVSALRAWKGRGPSHPVALLVTDAGAVERLGYDLGPAGRALARSLWPGPLTLVARATDRAVVFAPGVAREDGAVGFRCSPHPAAAALARAALERGLGPITATSLNHTGESPAADRAAALDLCGGPTGPLPWPERRPDAFGDRPSTVVDVTGPRPVVLRPGAVTSESIESIAEASADAQNQEHPDR
jgi:L-threonylcarbamoyladenylate synthase